MLRRRYDLQHRRGRSVFTRRGVRGELLRPVEIDVDRMREFIVVSPTPVDYFDRPGGAPLGKFGLDALEPGASVMAQLVRGKWMRTWEDKWLPLQWARGCHSYECPLSHSLAIPSCQIQ